MPSLKPHASPLVVILGPTSSGKSALGIKLARKFHGEIISADSRQVYKGMDLSTGKVTKKEQKLAPHHLLDIVSPKKQYSVAEFKESANLTIGQIRDKGNLPFLVGGTPFYIYSVVDNLEIPTVKPNLKLRKQLEKKTPSQLFEMLKKLDPQRAKNIDPHNPRRLIRAIEIIKSTGRPVPNLVSSPLITHPSTLLIGLNKPLPELYKAIDKRLKARLNSGMVNEIKKLHRQGVSYKRLYEMGLEARFVADYLQAKVTFAQMKEQLQHAIHKFAKRQMTWFKTDSRIHWVKNEAEAVKLVKQFIK